jgi:CRISPR/Cas system CSM-associated protein Csm3 (group 7 of RAMP superfamily)
MCEATLQTTTLSEWIVAGGHQGFSGADNAPMRDASGLPYLPARSLRGLLRWACKQVDNTLELGVVPDLFGEAGCTGKLRLGDAHLPRKLQEALQGAESAKRAELKEDFYTDVSRTRIDPQTGSAEDRSLRTMQVGIPGLVFVAPLEVPDMAALRLVAYATGLVRRLGANRYRGLGRCRVNVYRNDQRIAPTLADIQNIAGGHQS